MRQSAFLVLNCVDQSRILSKHLSFFQIIQQKLYFEMKNLGENVRTIIWHLIRKQLSSNLWPMCVNVRTYASTKRLLSAVCLTTRFSIALPDTLQPNNDRRTLERFELAADSRSSPFGLPLEWQDTNPSHRVALPRTAVLSSRFLS